MLRDESSFQNDQRWIIFWRKIDGLACSGRADEVEETLHCNMQGDIGGGSKQPADANGDRSQVLAEAGVLENLEQAFELLKTWLVDGKRVGDLPTRCVRRQSMRHAQDARCRKECKKRNHAYSGAISRTTLTTPKLAPRGKETSRRAVSSSRRPSVGRRPRRGGSIWPARPLVGQSEGVPTCAGVPVAQQDQPQVVPLIRHVGQQRDEPPLHRQGGVPRFEAGVGDLQVSQHTGCDLQVAGPAKTRVGPTDVAGDLLDAAPAGRLVQQIAAAEGVEKTGAVRRRGAARNALAWQRRRPSRPCESHGLIEQSQADGMPVRRSSTSFR